MDARRCQLSAVLLALWAVTVLTFVWELGKHAGDWLLDTS